MPFAPEKVTLEEIPDRPRYWLLTHDLVYTRPAHDGRPEKDYLAPSEPTDLASVPQAFTWLIPKYGQYTKAVIIHDRLVRQSEPSRFESDEILRDGMRELGVPMLRRWLIWAAVSWLTVVLIVRAHLRIPASWPRLLMAVPLLLVMWLVAFTVGGLGAAWWRWLLALIAVAIAVALAAAFAEPDFDAHMGGKIVGMLWLTLLGIPFLAVGLLALIALALYVVLEADPGKTPTPWRVPAKSPRMEAAITRARSV